MMTDHLRAVAYVRHMAGRHNRPAATSPKIRIPRPRTLAERIEWKETPTARRLLDR